MIDIKCIYINKTYRGQDFVKAYCNSCPRRFEATSEDGMLRCYYLRYYESYKPKRRIWGQELPGKPASVPTSAVTIPEHKEQQ